MESIVKKFKALSDPNRVRIMKMLEIRQLCVCEFTEALGLAASTVSKHLSILRDAGLIIDIKDGKWVEHKINRESADIVANQLLALLPVWANDDDAVKKDLKYIRSMGKRSLCEN